MAVVTTMTILAHCFARSNRIEAAPDCRIAQWIYRWFEFSHATLKFDEDRPRDVRILEPFLHRLDFDKLFLLGDPLVALDITYVPERGLERRAKPVGQFVVRSPGIGSFPSARQSHPRNYSRASAHSGVPGPESCSSSRRGRELHPIQLPVYPFAGHHRNAGR